MILGSLVKQLEVEMQDCITFVKIDVSEMPIKIRLLANTSNTDTLGHLERINLVVIYLGKQILQVALSVFN